MFGTKIALDPSPSADEHVLHAEDATDSGPRCWRAQRALRRMFLLFPRGAEERFKAYFQANSSIKGTRMLLALVLLWNLGVPYILLRFSRESTAMHVVGLGLAAAAGAVQLAYVCGSFLQRGFVVQHREALLAVVQTVSMAEGVCTVALQTATSMLFYVPFPFLFNFTRFYVAVSYP